MKIGEPLTWPAKIALAVAVVIVVAAALLAASTHTLAT